MDVMSNARCSTNRPCAVTKSLLQPLHSSLQESTYMYRSPRAQLHMPYIYIDHHQNELTPLEPRWWNSGGPPKDSSVQTVERWHICMQAGGTVAGCLDTTVPWRPTTIPPFPVKMWRSQIWQDGRTLWGLVLCYT